MNRSIGSIAILAAAASLAAAGDEASSDLAKVNVGEHWYGPKYSADDLSGHVVLFVFWGLR